jgi:hypothetical protein
MGFFYSKNLQISLRNNTNSPSVKYIYLAETRVSSRYMELYTPRNVRLNIKIVKPTKAREVEAS